MRGFSWSAIATLAVFSIASVPAKAHTTVLENGFFFITAPTVYDDLYIGVGAIVLLDTGVVIHGELEVAGGAWVSATGIIVKGEVECDGAAIVDIEHSTISGDVEIKHTGGASVLELLPSIFVFDNSIGGNLSVKNNNVNSINILNNRIRGKLQLSRNVAKIFNESGNVTHVKKAGK